MNDELRRGGQRLTCPCCGESLKLPEHWRLIYDPPPESCVECGSQIDTADRDGRCRSCHERAVYRASDEYRDVCVRRDALQDAAALGAIAANRGFVAPAGRELGVERDGDRNTRSDGEWFRRWLVQRGLMPAVYEIRREHGWRGDPPRIKPRKLKRPAPVLAFSKRAAAESRSDAPTA